MMKFLLSLFFIFIFRLLCSSEPSCMHSDLVKAYNEGDLGVLSIEGERIFLNPDRLILNQKGLFLELDSSYLTPLSCVFSDAEEGIWILSKKVYFYCPPCGIQYYNPGTL